MSSRIGLYGLIVLVYMVLASCDVFEFHPYDIRKTAGSYDLNNANILMIEQADDHQDTIRFAFMGDTQRFYDETAAFVGAVNERNDLDFVIQGVILPILA